MDIVSNYGQLTLTTYAPNVGPYRVRYTDVTNLPNIIIEKGDVDVESTDIALFGRLKIEYGEQLNESLLHIVENFNCPQDLTVTSGIVKPDLTRVNNSLLYNPVDGQLWYNATDERIYFWNGQYWIQITEVNDVAAAYGTILDGEQIPLPVSPKGIEYTYSDCIWVVSPNEHIGAFTYMRCSTDEEANVTMQYIFDGDSVGTPGTANYLIIAIDGNTDLGSRVPPEPPHENPSADVVSTLGTLGLIAFDTTIFSGNNDNIVSTIGTITITPTDSTVTVAGVTIIISSNVPELSIRPVSSNVNGLETIDVISYHSGELIITPTDSIVGTDIHVVSEYTSAQNLLIGGIDSIVSQGFNVTIVSPNSVDLLIESTDSTVYVGVDTNIVTTGYGTVVISENPDDSVVGWIDPTGRVACPIYAIMAYEFNWGDNGPHYIANFKDDGLLYYSAWDIVGGGITTKTIPWINDALLPTPFDLTQYTWTVTQVTQPIGSGGAPNLRWWVDRPTSASRIEVTNGLWGTMAQQPHFLLIGGDSQFEPVAAVAYSDAEVRLTINGPGVDNLCLFVPISPSITMWTGSGGGGGPIGGS